MWLRSTSSHVLASTPTHRHFLTKEERTERLESYAEELRKELAAVEERIKELKS